MEQIIKSKVTLRTLTPADEKTFYEAVNDPSWEPDWPFVFHFESVAHGSFAKFLSDVAPHFGNPKEALGAHLVPETFLFAFDKAGNIVGRVSIRHELNDFLKKVGGHIGYGVVPKYRRQGYASAILREALVYIKENLPHLHELLVTCDEGNTGSEKMIEKNGGELEAIFDLDDSPIRKKRYWIRL